MYVICIICVAYRCVGLAAGERIWMDRMSQLMLGVERYYPRLFSSPLKIFAITAHRRGDKTDDGRDCSNGLMFHSGFEPQQNEREPAHNRKNPKHS